MTYRTLLLVLYGAGLRISEAIGLTLADVDLAERVLTVRNTLFYKTRLVPIGPQLAAALVAYHEQRSKLPTPKTKDSAFLCSRAGGRLTYPQVVTLFQRIRSAAGIACPPGESRLPRLHDPETHGGRASRAGVVPRRPERTAAPAPSGDLPWARQHRLDTTSTQRYLQMTPEMTPELLQQASHRFAAYALQDAEQEIDHA